MLKTKSESDWTVTTSKWGRKKNSPETEAAGASKRVLADSVDDTDMNTETDSESETENDLLRDPNREWCGEMSSWNGLSRT